MHQDFKFFTALLLCLALQFACSQNPAPENKIIQDYHEGRFQEARHLIELHAKENPDQKLPEIYEIILAKMDRVMLDFSKTETEIKQELQKWFPEPDEELLKHWEESGKLEMKRIDGENRYFRNAVANLFRVDSTAMRVKEEKDGIFTDPLDEFCVDHTTELYSKFLSGSTIADLTWKFLIEYTITLPSGVVPPGEIIRCWLPFPRESLPRQRNVELLSVNSEEYLVADNTSMQRSLYIEKESVAGQDAIFSYTATFETSPQWFNIEPEKISPYDTLSILYRTYTAQRPPHIFFSEEIKKLAGEITAGLSDPAAKVKAIYYWINHNIPWASALEYSIMGNIPEYVLKNRRGDCGMQTLLFMTLTRYSGIPCKWQSGWMLHPGEVNLHDWAEVYYEGIGWVPVDQSFGLQDSDNEHVKNFYISGIDAWRLIVNDDYSKEFNPVKNFYRSEPIDFQRGELEWRGGNIYFNKWKYNMIVTRLLP
jgi:hypothetical protein